MKRLPTSLLAVQGSAIAVLRRNSAGAGANNDFISLTDIAKHKEPGRADHVIQNWMRNRNTVEFLGVWERLNNEAFNPLEFEGVKKPSGLK